MKINLLFSYPLQRRQGQVRGACNHFSTHEELFLILELLLIVKRSFTLEQRLYPLQMGIHKWIIFEDSSEFAHQ